MVYAQNASTPSKLSVLAPIVDFTDPKLPEGRCAHDARFDRYVEDCILEEVWVSRYGITLWGERWIRENIVDCFQFCMPGCLVLRHKCSTFGWWVKRRVTYIS